MPWIGNYCAYQNYDFHFQLGIKIERKLVTNLIENLDRAWKLLVLM